MHEEDNAGDSTDPEKSIQKMNGQMKEQFKNHNPELGDEARIKEVHRSIDYFFEYHFIVHGDYVQRDIYDVINAEAERICGKPDPTKYEVKTGQWWECAQEVEDSYVPPETYSKDLTEYYATAMDCFIQSFQTKQGEGLEECIDTYKNKRREKW